VISNIPKIKHTDSGNFFIMAGPCAIESKQLLFDVAGHLSEISNEFKIPLIFKSSYRKANRTKADSFTGIGDEKALSYLKEAGEAFDIPLVTDIHESNEAAMAAKYVDVLQIPAFLFRQSELLAAAAKTGKFINIKKGQFAGPTAMKFALDKCVESGNKNVIMTERGNFFGYGDMVVDFRNIPIMKAYGCPVVLDITHSLQQPNTGSGVTGGMPQYISMMGKLALAAGADGLFVETHPDPANAKSDGANMLPLSLMRQNIESWLKIYQANKP
jgi:2-dehydro-3-deoxyphosphooctonate aldolase (KDO 8-P synthase)